MLYGDLVFRLEHTRSEDWQGPQHFRFFKLKGLMDDYESFFATHASFRPRRIFELGIFDGGSAVLWYEIFHPEKLVAIDVADREDSPYFREYVRSRDLAERICTYWRVNQADKDRLRRIVAEEFDGGPDLVIDDCSHLYAPTLASFEALFPLMSPGGLYVIEDWAWAHWPESGTLEHGWAAEQPLTDFVFKLVEAAGSSHRGLIQGLTIGAGFVVIERGSGAIRNRAEFRLEDFIVRRPTPGLGSPAGLRHHLARFRAWASRVLPPQTVAGRAARWLKMRLQAGRKSSP